MSPVMKVGGACEWRRRVAMRGSLICGLHSMLNTTTAVLYTTAWQGTNGVITEGGVTGEDDDIVGFKSKSFCDLTLFNPVTRQDNRHPDSCLA